jgi:hypothetical protein
MSRLGSSASRQMSDDMSENIMTEPVAIEDESVIEEEFIIQQHQLLSTIPLHTHPGTVRPPVVILQQAHAILKKEIKPTTSIYISEIWSTILQTNSCAMGCVY